MACIRRGLIVALIALASLFVGDAYAQRCSSSYTVNNDPCADQGSAYAAAWAAANEQIAVWKAANPNDTRVACLNTTTPSVTIWIRLGGTCGGSNHKLYTRTYPSGQTCASRSNQYNWAPPGGTVGESVCSNGCRYDYVLDPSPPGNFFAPTGTMCQQSEFPAPTVDTDGDGVPDEDDAFPDDPNESQDTDGDGIGDNADFSPNDPTDGSDTPGEEDGDDEGDNTASGGGDCKAPPSCKGDGIQCNQLFQQWQIRCSGATVTGDPTNCASGYSCSGDSVQCATVALLRKTACATGDDGGTGGTPGDANGNGVADVLEGSGAGDTGDPGESDNVTRFGIGVDDSLLDQENIFGAGSCPTPPSLTIMGQTVSGADFPYWCQAMAILRALILIFGAFIAVKILTGWGFA